MAQAVQDSSAESNDFESCKIQLKAYAKVDARLPERPAEVPMMVSITAPPSGLTAEQREPVDLVVVLHVRDGCKVPEKWKELLVQAVEVIVEKLDDKDSLAVVPGQSTLQPMSAANKEEASDAASKVVIRSDTSVPRDPKTGKMITIDNSVLKDLESAESILYDRRYGDEDRRAGYIIVISNSNDDIESLLNWSFRSVHAFGFRDSRNARAMHSIASSRDCTYAILDDEHGRITGALAGNIDRITSAMPIEVILKCEQQVELSPAMEYAPRISYFISQDRKVGILWGSAHLGGVATNFVINMYVPHDQHKDLRKLISVQVKYGHVWDKLDGQVVAVEKGTDGSKEVAAEIVRIWAFKIVDEIIADDQKDSEQLHAELHQRWTKLKDSDCGKEASESGLISGLTAEMQEMEIRLYNSYLWLEYMLSWQSYQRWQLPLPHLFMEKQVTDDSLLQLRIFSKVPGTTTQHQQGHTVLLRLMAPEAGLATAKRPSVDLITILDVEKETLELELLIKAMDVTQREIHELELVIKAMVFDLTELKKKIEKKKKKTDKEKDKTEMEEKVEADIEKKKTDMKNKETDMKNKETDMKKMKTEKTDMEKKIQKKRELLIKAMDVVMEKLSHKDRLAIISIQSSVDEPAAGLLEMCKQRRSETSTMVRKLLTTSSNDTVTHTQSQTSHWRDQIKKSMKLVRKCLHTSLVNSPIPTPTSPKSQSTASTRSDSVAIAGSTKLWKALTDATKILDDRQGEEKDRVGLIIVISDRDGLSIGQESLSSNYITHAFGFGDNDTDSTRVMHHVASSSNGIYAILNDDRDQISEPFTECIRKITSIVAVQAKLDIECSHSSTVTLSTVGLWSGQAKLDMIDDDKKSAGSIFAGVFSAGTVKNFIVYVDNVDRTDDDHDDNNVSELLGVHVKWLRAPTSREEEGKLDGQVVIDGSKEVAATIARIEVAKIVRKIIDLDFDKKLLADMAARSEAVKIVSERTKQKIKAEFEYEITEAMVEKLARRRIDEFQITEPSLYNAKLVAAMLALQKMCHEGWEKARAAGEARLAREMKKTKDSLEKEMEKMDNRALRKNTNTYYLKKLVEDRLPYMLYWLDRQVVIDGSEGVVATIARIEAAKIVRKIIDPDFDKKMLADMAARSEAVKIVSERTKQKIKAEFEYEITEAMVEKLARRRIDEFEITKPSYNAKLVAAMLQKMCREGWEKAEVAGEARLAREMRKMEDSVEKEMEDSLKKEIEITNTYLKKLAEKLVRRRIDEFEITEPSYDAKLVAAMLQKMCREGWEKAEADGEARLAREIRKMEDSLKEEMEDSLKKEIEITNTYLKKLAEKLVRRRIDEFEITEPSYDAKLVAAMLQKMCHEGWEKAEAAGEAREIKKMEDSLKKEMKDSLEKEIEITNTYLKKLVKDRLPYMLSWLSFQMLSEKPPALP